MVHHEKCPLCASVNLDLYLECADHSVSGEVFKLVRCTSCGFILTQDHPDERSIGKYYESENYISHSDTSAGIVNKLYHGIRQFMIARKRDLVIKLTGLRKGTLLDVGSGTGHFLSIMKRTGWNVKGIEINEKARRAASTSSGTEVISPDGISLLEKQSFDCITLWHVLEHFEDPSRYFSELITLLRNDGICLVALPNCDSYDAGNYRQYWAAYDVPRHLWHFSPDTFLRFAGKTGMKLESMMILPFDVFYIAILSEKYTGALIPLFKGILKGLWYSSMTLFNRKKASSVIYVLRKSGS